MAGKVVNSSFVLLNNFGVSRQVNASKVATSHIRKPVLSVGLMLQKPTLNVMWIIVVIREV